MAARLAANALDDIAYGLDALAAMETRALAILQPAAPVIASVPEMQAAMALDAETWERFEDHVTRDVAAAIGTLVAAQHAGMEPEALAALVAGLLPVFAAADDLPRDDIELLAAPFGPGGAGSVYIAGTADGYYDFSDTHGVFGANGGIFIDLGGNDTYRAAGDAFGSRGGVFIDLAGNDDYAAGPADARDALLGHRSFGLQGLFLDVAGDDRYAGGAFTFGVGRGLFFDAAGNDTYRSGVDSLGNTDTFGSEGGVFVDLAGDDVSDALSNSFGSAGGFYLNGGGDDLYRLGYPLGSPEPGVATGQANSFGAFGGGTFIDWSGDDQYFVRRGNGNFGANGLFLDRDGNDWYGKTRAMEPLGGTTNSFGMSVLGTSRGVFIDAAGDDHYFANSAAFGSNMGIFLELGGNDTYTSLGGQSFGAGAALNPPGGLFLDVGGDDVYHVQDGGLAYGAFGAQGGVFIDRCGNDSYTAQAYSFGAGILHGGLFVDIEGDDVYTATDFSFGHRGVFIDASGDDRYTGRDHVFGAPAPLPSDAGPVETAGVFLDAAGQDDYVAQGVAFGVGGTFVDEGGTGGHNSRAIVYGTDATGILALIPDELRSGIDALLASSGRANRCDAVPHVADGFLARIVPRNALRGPAGAIVESDVRNNYVFDVCAFDAEGEPFVFIDWRLELWGLDADQAQEEDAFTVFAVGTYGPRDMDFMANDGDHCISVLFPSSVRGTNLVDQIFQVAFWVPFEGTEKVAMYSEPVNALIAEENFAEADLVDDARASTVHLVARRGSPAGTGDFSAEALRNDPVDYVMRLVSHMAGLP